MFKDFQQSIEILASPEVVFQTIVKEFEEMVGHGKVAGLTLDHSSQRVDGGEIAIGSRWEITLHDPSQKSTIKVTEFDPPHVFSTRSYMSQVKFEIRYVISENESSSILTRSHRILKVGVLMKLLTTFRGSKSNLEGQGLEKLTTIKSLAESDRNLRV